MKIKKLNSNSLIKELRLFEEKRNNLHSNVINILQSVKKGDWKFDLNDNYIDFTLSFVEKINNEDVDCLLSYSFPLNKYDDLDDICIMLFVNHECVIESCIEVFNDEYKELFVYKNFD